MLEALKGLFGSKTTWLAVVGSAVLVLVAKVLVVLNVPVELQQTILVGVAGFFGMKGFQQGMADVGKEKAKIEAKVP